MSFAPFFSSGAAAGREFNYTEFVGKRTSGWAVRDAQYKLIETRGARRELFDLSSDLSESHDLIGRRDLSHVVTQLADHARAIRQRKGATDGNNISR